MENTPKINRFLLARSHAVKVKSKRPKICQTIHPPHPWASSTSQGAISPSFDPRGPHQAPKRTENTPHINCFPLSRFHAFKVKLWRPKICQTIHPQQPQASSTSQEAISPSCDPRGPHQTPKRMENTPQINRFPLARFFAVSQVVAAQNLPDNPPTAPLGLIHVPGGHFLQP